MQNYRIYLVAGLLAVVAGLVLVYLPKNSQPANQDGQNNTDNEPIAEVNDFLSCSVAGYAVMESYPRQCVTPDGEVFVEDVEEVEEQADVVIETPLRGQVVASPLTVSGKARGTWFFEANLPVTLKDLSGNVLAQVGAQAVGDWMTEDHVNFTIVLEFEVPSDEFGVLVIEKDNPSGLEEFDKSFTVPVRFR